jgi:L-malate glycosyltransferase
MDDVPPSIHVVPSVLKKTQVGVKHMIQTIGRLRAISREISPDVLHAGPVTTCAFWAALASNSPLLAMSWNYDLLRNDLRLRDSWKNTFALRRARAAVCDSEHVRHKILALAPALRDRIFVFPWGVELDRFHPAAELFGCRSARGWQDNILVLSTRSLHPMYGTCTLIEAGIMALKEAPNLRFVLAADGPLRDWCQKRVRQSGVSEAFWFLGEVSQDRMPGLFVEADLYVSASLTDGTSISLLQAMACGRSVVVSDVPGNREWVQPGVNGWLAPVGIPAQWAQALVDFSRLSSSRKAEIQQANLTLARKRADWDHNFQTLLTAYDFIASTS